MRVNAISSGVLAFVTAFFALGYADSNPVWMVALLAVAAMFATIGVLLARDVAWAVPVGIGMTAYASFAMGQSAIAIGVFVAKDPWGATFQACALMFVGCFVAFCLFWLPPRTMGPRLACSVAFAGAALIPSVTFALAPGQSMTVAAAMLVGAGLLLAGTVALGRGRTWGLLGNLAGAVTIAVGVWFAPALGVLEGGHPWLPDSSSLLVNVIGTSAAAMALVSSLIYAGPVLRFLVRGSKDAS